MSLSSVKGEGIDLSSIKGAGWPITFESDTKEILLELVLRYNQFIKKWANPKKRIVSLIGQRQDGKLSLSDEKRPNNLFNPTPQ